MPFVFKKISDHGTTNPIVARMSLQALQLLKQSTASKDVREKIGKLYVESLQPKLLRCWEISERYCQEFNSAASAHKPPSAGATSIEVPQIPRLEEECHNYLYEAKNYIRDLLKVINILYGSDFKEASEFYRARKGGVSLVEYAASQFGKQDSKTLFLEEAAPGVEMLVAFRNAVEHPDGYSGVLRIENFSLDPDGKITEPTWHREKDGKPATDLMPIRSLEVIVENLLQLGEDVLVSWVANNLKVPGLMRVAMIPEDRRAPKCPIKWTVTLSQQLEERLANLESKKS